jgi:hypothetical protein
MTTNLGNFKNYPTVFYVTEITDMSVFNAAHKRQCSPVGRDRDMYCAPVIRQYLCCARNFFSDHSLPLYYFMLSKVLSSGSMPDKTQRELSIV